MGKLIINSGKEPAETIKSAKYKMRYRTIKRYLIASAALNIGMIVLFLLQINK